MLLKQKIYMETSVISYLVAKPSNNIVVAAHQSSTRELWNHLNDYQVFISDIVIREASKGDKSQARLRGNILEEFSVLEVNDDAKFLAQKFLAGGIIPEKCPEDALHVAVAAAHGIDLIVTWNFKHINNPFIRKRIRQIVEGHGWVCPEMCSPEELLGDTT